MLNKSGEGVVLFSFNTGDIDYLSLALYCAERVTRIWDLPVTVVTDTLFSDPRASCVLTESPKDASLRLYRDYDKGFKFLNTNRLKAWELSPYESTIVIDSDLLISTRQIPSAWDGKGVKLTQSAYSISGEELYQDMRLLSDDGLSMYWATILCFDRSLESKLFFEYWEKVVTNYRAYSFMYGYNPNLMRNDYCVTVALDLLAQDAGGLAQFTLPYSIPTADQDSFIVDLDRNIFKVKGVELEFSDSDVHVLNKKSLLELITERTT